MQKLALVLALIALVGLGAHLMSQKTQRLQAKAVSQDDAWTQWKVTFRKRYGKTEEEAARRAVFEQNKKHVDEVNAKKLNYTFGYTEFMDLKPVEFAAKHLGMQKSTKGRVAAKGRVADKMVKNLKDNLNVDWRSKGAVGPVLNQGSCGSCWAFSAVGALEGFLAVTGKGLQSLSQQDLVDCSNSYGNHGCNGGLMSYALSYVRDHGIAQTKDYAYTARQGGCKNVPRGNKIGGVTNINNCNGLASALQKTPVAVGVDATNFQFYKSGVFSNCGTRLNHGVTLVGATPSYWLIRNSWSQSWGEAGYIRLARGNTCGVCNTASIPK